ncbi:MAG TPA: alkaline phosphatase family protein [Gemmata sp.]|jgi:YVTN family beta-propeller protein|nr:alkaline phosphatase family protein [Gemmata sp.]
MRWQSLAALGLMLLGGIGLFAFSRPAQPPGKDDPKPVVSKPLDRVLPGLLKDGFVQLPNQWKLKPAGRQLELGDLPVNIAIHPTGEFAAVLCAGYKEHEVIVVDLNPDRTRVVSRVQIDQAFYGLAFSDDGRQVFASGGEFEVVHVFDFDRGYLTKGRPIDVSAGKDVKAVVGGITLDAAGRDLLVASPWADAVIRVPLVNPDNKKIIPMVAIAPKKEPGKGEPPSPPDGRKEPKAKVDEDDPPAKFKEPQFYPYTCLAEPDGKRAFVSLWARGEVAVIDMEKNAVVQTWSTAEHPTEMVLSPDGKALYVACANSTKVSVLDPATGKPLQTINCALYPGAPNGNTPNSLAITPDGEVLFVANADANNIAMLNVSDHANAKPLGFIPTGWYPTSVRFNPKDKNIYVANGKGLSSKPNRSGPNPLLPRARNLNEYIGQLFPGTLGIVKLPTPAGMATYSKTAYACSPLQKSNVVRSEDVESGNPIPQKLGDPSPIKHVLYIVKENRTYDQILGDIKEGNGDPGLCLFPESVTPNHHKIAREFVLLDNFYVDGEVSADGHEWTMGAYATDFVEKIWPLSYRGGKIYGYPSEGAKDLIARPSGGYLWDKCIEAKVSYRTYGEWVTNGKMKADGTFEDGKPSVKALEGKFDPQFRGYDLDYPDVKRAERFISELKRFETTGDMPRMQVLRLPNDHTAGTRVGKPTVTAMVADNDLALGMVVEAVSNSKFWKEMAIFVIEDDTQNGADHIDAHRCPALVISPHTKRKFVDSTLYSTTSMLRTMELIVGVQPMSQFDAAARPMYNAFSPKLDLTAFKHEVPKVDLKELNRPGGFGASWMEKQDLSKEDLLDDIAFNEIIWKAVRGVDSFVPPPTRAAFFVPVTVKKPDDDDDDDD